MTSGQMLPTLSGDRIRVDQRKAPAQAILSLGSPNTNLPYLVTMETGAAYQSYFTEEASCRQQTLGLGGVQSPFPLVPQSPLGDQPPCEVGALSDTEWLGWGGWGVGGVGEVSEEKDMPARDLLFPGNADHISPPWGQPRSKASSLTHDTHRGVLGHCQAAPSTVTLPTMGSRLCLGGTGPRDEA